MAAVPASLADTVTLKNGDHLTGTITGSDGKELTLKTDYAGEIKIQWTAVMDVTSAANPLYVVTLARKTVNGNDYMVGLRLGRPHGHRRRSARSARAAWPSCVPAPRSRLMRRVCIPG